MPRDVGISSIFNVSDLYLYHLDEFIYSILQERASPKVSWEVQLPKATSTIPKTIMDRRVSKKTKGNEYYEYLIKWKDHLMEDSTWMTIAML